MIISLQKKMDIFLSSQKAYKDALSDMEIEVGVLMQTMSELAKKYKFPTFPLFNHPLYYREELKKIVEITTTSIYIKTKSEKKIVIPVEFLYLSKEELENKYKAEAIKYKTAPKKFLIGMNVKVCNQDYEPHYNGRIGFIENIETNLANKRYLVSLYPIMNDVIVYDKELSKELLYLSENEIKFI